ncbi:MAG: hypothetical protein ACQERR_06255 [Pseudomonadota bacterium]
MRLRELDIRRLPGIDRPFAVDELADGINLVIGPNAGGKSSLVRAVLALLDDRAGPGGTALHLAARWNDADGEEWMVERMGRETTWQHHGRPKPPPSLPEPHLLPCYTLGAETLGAVDRAETEAHIESVLRRQLAGGFDLPALSTEGGPFHRKSTLGREEARVLRDAERELEAARAEQRRLRESENTLAELEGELAAARATRQRLPRLEKALELARSVNALAAAESAVADFPDGMARLKGDETRRIDAELRQRAEAEQRRADCARAEAAAREEQRATGLTIPPDGAALEAMDERLHELERLREQLETSEARLVEARARAREAAETLGGSGEPSPRLDPASVARVEEALEELRGASNRRAALELALEGRIGPASQDDPERLEEAIGDLGRWLEQAVQPVGGRWPVSIGSALVGVAVAGLLAVGGPSPFALGFAALAVSGAGLAAWPSLLAALGARRAAAARRELEQYYRRSHCANGLEAPETWERDAVASCRRRLESRLARARRAEESEAQRQRLEEERRRHQMEEEAAEAELAGWIPEVGFDPRRQPASLGRWLQRAAAHDRAAAEVAEAEAERSRLQQRADAVATALVGDLDHWPAPSVDGNGASPAVRADTATLRAALKRLRERAERYHQAEQRAVEQQHLAEQHGETAAARDAAIAAIYEQAGLPDGERAELERRLERFEAWREAIQERDLQQRQVEQLRPQLADDPDWRGLAEAGDEGRLEQTLVDQQGIAAEYDRHQEEVTRIRAELEQARRQRPLEAARRDVQKARDALGEARREAVLKGAGQWLVESVQAEQTHRHQPATLRRADEWLGRFTRGGYGLRLDPDTGRLSALEHGTGQWREPARLSTGTRMQMVLALRIAFALESEAGREPLPFFLDEALTTTDPERFRAVADSLALLAREEGRQVFYLTAQPGDIALWRAAEPAVAVIDLAAVRGRAAAVPAEALSAPEPTPVPAPTADETPEAYAERLGVPAIDPWQPAEAIPVFHLLRDDLDTVQRATALGASRLGELEARLAGPVGEWFPEAERLSPTPRFAVARAWLRAWCRGRGRPLTRADLHLVHEAGIVSDTFFDRVAALVDEHGGDAAAVVDALRNKAVSGFRANKIDELEQWLADHDHLDHREPSTADDRYQAALIAAADHAPALDPETIRAWCHWLEAGLGTASGTGPTRPVPRPVEEAP